MAGNNEQKRDRRRRAEQMRKERERAQKRRRNLLTTGIVVVVVALIAIAGVAIKAQVGKDDGPMVAPKSLTKDGGVVFDQAAATGKPAANAEPVQVVVYEDFQCPYCKQFEGDSGKYLEQQVESGVISVEYRPIAFLNDYSTRALNASMCVFEDKGAKAFHTFHGLLFANQPDESSGSGLPDSELVDFARRAGTSGVRSCIDDGTYTAWAKDHSDQVIKKIGGTPQVSVDGKVITGGGVPGRADVQKVIEAAK